MMADRVRMDAFARALHSVVRPDSVVLDIGTGTGVMALLACRLGARRVYAIEPLPAIQMAREVVKANGFADRVTFFERHSSEVVLPEQADVVVSDLRGAVPLYGTHLVDIVDIRKRLLAPDGVLVGQRDHLFAAVVEAEEAYTHARRPWQGNDLGFDMRPAERLLLNQSSDTSIEARELMSQPVRWATLDYPTLNSPHVAARFDLVADRAATARGLLIWFDAVLADDIGFSNHPAEPPTVYGRVFLPWLDPVPLDPGDRVEVKLRADLVGRGYIWAWATRVFAGTREKAAFEQSNWEGLELTLARVRRASPEQRVMLNDAGQVDAYVLAAMSSGMTNGEIATALLERFPGVVVDRDSALVRVGELARRYGRDG